MEMQKEYNGLGLDHYHRGLYFVFYGDMADNMINAIIRAAIDAIGAGYKDGTREWLANRNPLALRQLDALEVKVDAAALAGDIEATRKACNVWQGSWLFWSGNFKRGL